ncbi:MAG TPA: adenylate kinase [Pseudoclavibacter sp.]|nr:adenylate kinase [Pseudoclavibacter sp.]
MARLLIVGPPGAGKGTQASGIAQRLGIPAISTGDIFRKNVAEQTELGREAKRYMDAGEYVPDSLTNALVRSRLSEPDARRGFLLDGYPRTLDQVRELDEILAASGDSLDAVIELQADSDVVVRRLLARAQEQGRSDDTEDVIRTRLAVYAEQTTPLIDAYGKRGLLVSVDGMGTVNEVADAIAAGLAARGISA